MENEQLINHEARLRILEERNQALQLVLSWLLACQPDDSAMRFLSSQAKEMDGNPRFQNEVDLLDELREDVAQWHVQWRAADKPQGS